MKLSVMLLVFPVLLFAQDVPDTVIMTKKVLCAAPDKVMHELSQSQFAEQPFWQGQDQNEDHVVLLVNKQTKTWTLIEYNDKNACILSSGDGHKQIFIGPRI